MKWHKISAVVMAVSAAVCIYSGHRMVNPKKKVSETDSGNDIGSDE